MKALVSKLQEVVDNDNLPYFDGAVIELQPPYDSYFLGDSINRNDPCYIKLLNGKFSDNSIEKELKDLTAQVIPNDNHQKVLAIYSPFHKLRVGPIDYHARAKNIQHVFDWAGADTTGLYFSRSYGYGDIEAVKNLTTLTTIKLDNTKVTGDIEAVKNLTTLTTLELSNTKVIGDIKAVKNLTTLTTLGLSNTKVIGDIEAVKNLTTLTTLGLSFTKISGNINNINANKCTAYIDGTSINGELSTVNCLALAPNREKFTWASSSSRRNKGLSGLYIINYSGGVNLGDDVDNCLIDEASLDFPEVAAVNKVIYLKGTRTSASDAAVATLKGKGISVYINGTKI